MADSSHWYYVWANFWLQKFIINSNLRNKITPKIYNPRDLYLPATLEKFTPPYTTPNGTQNLVALMNEGGSSSGNR